MLCPSCHAQNRENAKFCKVCGWSFTSETVAEGIQVQGDAPNVTIAGQADVTANPSSEPTLLNQSTTSRSTSVSETEDVSLAPTQILTPQQMMAYHMRRWQQEIEQQAVIPEQQSKRDIADVPTVLFTSTSYPVPTPAQPAIQNTQLGKDIADAPTVLMAPGGPLPGSSPLQSYQYQPQRPLHPT